MNTKTYRRILLIIQMFITASIIFADACGIATPGSFSQSKPLIESLVRCLSTLAFTIFYYVSVKDSFSSESLFFPLYLLFLSVSETRILEVVEQKMNLFLIPQQHLVFTLICSAFMLVLTIIGYALLPNGSKGETNLFTGASVVVSIAIAFYAPKAQNISSTWNSQSLIFILTFFFVVGLIISIIQFFLESLTSSKIKYIICIILLINNYINLVFNTTSMNLAGTILFFGSIVLTVILVEINSTKL